MKPIVSKHPLGPTHIRHWKLNVRTSSSTLANVGKENDYGYVTI